MMLRLRKSVLEDAGFFRAIHDVPARNLMFSGPLESDQVIARFFAQHIELGHMLTVEDDEESVLPYGFVWFDAVDEHSGSAYFTVGLIRRGKGVGRNLVPLVQEHAFDEMGLHRLATTVVDENEAAHSILEDVPGVNEDGILREAFRDAQGKYHDVTVYSLLAREWVRG